MSADFEAFGTNKAAPFTLRLHRGDGMALVAMNWRKGKPPADFVGFTIEYRVPKGDRFVPVQNRLNFPKPDGKVDRETRSSRFSPIQTFRWVHFPFDAELDGPYTYRVTPVFMDDTRELSYGEPQEAAIELRRETYPGQLNVTFTRGFVLSQAFVDRYEEHGGFETLIPETSHEGPTFVPTHPDADRALAWMGFEARSAVLEVLDRAIKDKSATVKVVAFDLSERHIIEKLKKLGKRLRIIIDDSKDHAEKGSGENQAAAALSKTAGKANVKRQHMGSLQHNKTIVVDGKSTKLAVCGSTNFSWRGLYVQSNNAIVLQGAKAIAPFLAAFDAFWENDTPATFAKAGMTEWQSLGLAGIDAHVCFFPHGKDGGRLSEIAADIAKGTKSSLLYSLAFLSTTPKGLKPAIKQIADTKDRFVYGMAELKVKELEMRAPGGNVSPVYPVGLGGENLPEPFKSEPTAGRGNKMHHKFVVIDFDRPTARVYLGSHNFSKTADESNGENLLLIKNRRIAVSYMVEAIRIFDHYRFRVINRTAKKTTGHALMLKLPPSISGAKAWWDKFYTDPRRVRDREIFA